MIQYAQIAKKGFFSCSLRAIWKCVTRENYDAFVCGEI